ncbi:hypothetical protein CTEN210_11202 [Chaetoceros tenuissimus]|uniref:Methyltransferase domain-containing protein n=1 Tax=Chaetoceros tenuissimus TaxID=426638 RepID=A0AAD3D0V9_9STRA|nr:hypothetical protein CTEN210_11202 [Chaetoceros tenuissimus]
MCALSHLIAFFCVVQCSSFQILSSSSRHSSLQLRVDDTTETTLIKNVVHCGSRRSMIQETFHNLLVTANCGLVFAASAPRADAISSEEAQKSYDKYAATYDELDGGKVADSLGIEAARSKLLQQARGRTLEIGVGTGLNLQKYKFASSPTANDGVTSLTLLDISEGMMGEAKSKLANLDIPEFVDINFVRADATSELANKFEPESFDTIVDTFSLCVMGNIGAKQCLSQMSNVVKKETGRILLIENSRSSNSFIGAYQDLTAAPSATFGGKGCVSNQNVEKFIQDTAGLHIIKQEEFATGLFRSFICKCE